MKNFTLGLVLVTGTFALTGACGGDDSSDSTDGSGGSATGGSGGKASGGSSGKGGSTGSGNTTGSAGDNASSGGDLSGGGGVTNAGGASGFDNPEGCPTTAPSSDSACDVETGFEGCLYPGERCDCGGFQQGQGGADDGRTWTCEGGGELCPDTQPEGSCSQGNGGAGNGPPDELFCPYPPDVQCWCGNNDEWFCLDPNGGNDGQGGAGNQVPDCPDTQPEGTCENRGFNSCDYGDTTCWCAPEDFGPDPDYSWQCN